MIAWLPYAGALTSTRDPGTVAWDVLPPPEANHLPTFRGVRTPAGTPSVCRSRSEGRLQARLMRSHVWK